MIDVKNIFVFCTIYFAEDSQILVLNLKPGHAWDF